MDYRSTPLQIVYNGFTNVNSEPKRIAQYSLSTIYDLDQSKHRTDGVDEIECEFCPPPGMRWDEYGNPELLDD